MVTIDTETAPAATYEKGKLYDLPIGDLNPDPNQPRKSMDPQALEELTASIKRVGIIQPLLFRVDADSGNLILVAGERRFRAAQLAGLATVPGICVEGNPAEIALVENLLRQDLTAVEEAEALQSLMTEQKYTQEQLAGVIGKARTTITDILTLTRLPQAIRDECRGSLTVTRKTLIEIARKKQERAMLTVWNKYKEKAARETAGKQPRVKTPENAEEVVKWLGKAITKLDALDIAAWTEDEKSTFNQTLLDLQKTIQSRLTP